jgi:hypothetical protein
MNPIENYISDAIEIVSSWDLEEDSFAGVVNMQVRLMAGYSPEDVSQSPEDHSFQTH